MGKKGDIYRYIVTRLIGVVSYMGHVTVPERISCHILPTGQYKGNVRQCGAIYGNIKAMCGICHILPVSNCTGQVEYGGKGS